LTGSIGRYPPKTQPKNERIIITPKKKETKNEWVIERELEGEREEGKKMAFFCASANLCLQLFNASFVCPNFQPCSRTVCECVCVCGCHAKMPACISVSGQCNADAAIAYGRSMAAHVRRPCRPCRRCRLPFAFCAAASLYPPLPSLIPCPPLLTPTARAIEISTGAKVIQFNGSPGDVDQPGNQL